MGFHQNLWLLNLSVPARASGAIGEALGGDAVAVSVFAPPRGDKAQIEAIYDHEPQKSDISLKLAVLAAALSIPLPKFTVRPAPQLDWLEKVAADFPPLSITRWTVHGALHRGKVPNRLHALQIDATNAFGTGEHPTTRGCLIMLDRILKSASKPRRMADIGCGSGVLAMAFVKAARGQAVAVDLDADSVRIARENVRSNGLGSHIRVGPGRGYSPALLRRAAPFDLIMANIFANPLCQMASSLKNNLKPGGIAILSGLLMAQANKVISAHKAQGLALVAHRRIGEWSVLALKRYNRA